MLHADATFEIKSGDQTTYAEWGGDAKLTRANILRTYVGDLVGEGNFDLLTFYSNDHTGQFVGLERVNGTLHGRMGTFVMQLMGTFGSAGVQVKLTILPGSGTGELAGISGEGAFLPHTSHPVPIELNYEFE